VNTFKFTTLTALCNVAGSPFTCWPSHIEVQLKLAQWSAKTGNKAIIGDCRDEAKMGIGCSFSYTERNARLFGPSIRGDKRWRFESW
jgi:hypothetical protein